MKILAAVLLLTATSAHAADYGAYLTAQFAASQGQIGLAANEMLTALDADPANAQLQKDAFGLSLLAGRPAADKLATLMPQNPIAELVAADAAGRAGKWDRAELAYAELPHESLMDLLRPVLLAWAQQAQGDTDKALDTLQASIDAGHMATFYTLHAALIADVARRDGLADRLYRQLADDMTEPNVRMAEIEASWQARSGHAAAARATIDALIHATPELEIVRRGLMDSIAKPQVPDARAGIAEAYTGMAGALRQEKDGELPPMLLQLALRMQPDLTEAHLVQSELAAAQKHYGAAADALQTVPSSDPLAPVVQLHEASYLARSGHAEKAVSLLERLESAYPDRPEPPTQLGDVYIGQRMYADAVGAYTRAIARTPHPTRTDWSLFYAQGAAYERVHDWARAEADMKRALQLDPNQAVVLNFLGFSWTEQNRNLSEAHDMIQRALDQRPNDGQIVDSLGWVDLRQGDVAQAVRLLEHAAELQPTDPTITGHLGDAYWEAGRHLEAEDQWRRALVEQPDPDDAARIEARLKSAGSE
jgi:tetratricopeptide (TPR) repeat protein